mmetsp:Transcript_97553/g.172707  ORF Transcript_97553/g.172707 Transcript_97553/m.172707 type:complete len:213 (-) Transcript_97553:129-767(-)
MASLPAETAMREATGDVSTEIRVEDEERKEKEAREQENAAEALAALQAHLKLNLSYIEPLSNGPAEILPHLYLGSSEDAWNVQVLRRIGITHVLNCAARDVKTGAARYSPYGIGYTEFIADDCQGYNIMQHYDLLSSLADQAAEQGGKLFIHCQAGVNRSGTLCLAYYTANTGRTLLQSARDCKERRGRICTNTAFQRQVFDWARARRLPLK